MAQKHVALSLLWRTFFLLAILLAGGVFAWTQTLKALERARKLLAVREYPEAHELTPADEAADIARA